MAEKLFYLKFVFADWDRDTASLSLPARAIWLHMIGHAMTSRRCGYFLSPSGEPFTDEQAARVCRCSVEDYRAALDELKSSGVASFDRRGIPFCRRMAKEDELRSKDRIRKGESRQGSRTKRTHEVQGIGDKSLECQPKCPEVVRDVSGESPPYSYSYSKELEVNTKQKADADYLRDDPSEEIAAAWARIKKRHRRASPEYPANTAWRGKLAEWADPLKMARMVDEAHEAAMAQVKDASKLVALSRWISEEYWRMTAPDESGDELRAFS